MVNNWRIILTSAIIIITTIVFPTTNIKAQNITLDGSLGKQETINGRNYQIPQSVGQTAGNNLFHSFDKFNLNANETAIFESADNIRNILSRVTGGVEAGAIGKGGSININAATLTLQNNTQLSTITREDYPLAPTSLYDNEVRSQIGLIYHQKIELRK